MGMSNDTSEKKSKKTMAMGDRAILPEGARTIPIYIMGKKFEVPETLTIMKAMEYAGFQFMRGCGCRGGICGACSTVYRKPDDYKLQVGLACQTVVEPDMYLTQMPFFPANRASYRLEDLEGKPEEIFKLYPEVFRCVACNACTKACPMDVKVLDYVSAVKQGNIAKAAQISFDCVQCGSARADAWESFPSITLLNLPAECMVKSLPLNQSTWKSGLKKLNRASMVRC